MGAEMIEQPPITVLLVEPEKELRERLGSWLEGDGFEVMVCPGPGRPDYTCVGTSRGACPLLDAASIVVMDLALPGDDVMRGTSRWDLLSSYVGADRPVVAIAQQGETISPFQDEPVHILRWPMDRQEMLGAVRCIARNLRGAESGIQAT